MGPPLVGAGAVPVYVLIGTSAIARGARWNGVGATVEYVPNAAGGSSRARGRGSRGWGSTTWRSVARRAAVDVVITAAGRFPRLGVEATKGKPGETMTLVRLTQLPRDPVDHGSPCSVNDGTQPRPRRPPPVTCTLHLGRPPQLRVAATYGADTIPVQKSPLPTPPCAVSRTLHSVNLLPAERRGRAYDAGP